MCGIIGYTGNKEATPILLEGLSKLEYRGYDSAGVAVLCDNNIAVSKTVGRISSLIKETNGGNSIVGKTGIGHTRWATHGEPTVNNAHPHTSADGKFAVVHNGIIENYAKLKSNLCDENVSFKSETDTEVVPHLLEKYYNGNLIETVSAVAKMLDGSFALGIICSDFPNTVVAVKKFSPLIVGIGNGFNLIASDITAIVSHTKDVVYLEDGEIAVLSKEKVDYFNFDAEKIEKKAETISFDVSSAEKDGFEHFMLKEIFEQPKAIEQTLLGRIKDDRVYFENFSLTKEKLKAIKKINIIGCGSAYHAGIVGKYVFEEMLRIPCEAFLASEFRYQNPLVTKDTLTIVISQSGETADTLAALKESKRLGSHILSIVNVVGSTIAKASDDVLYTRAGPEIAVATTKGYMTQIITLYLFAAYVAQILGATDQTFLAEFIKDLQNIPDNIREILKQKDGFNKMSKRCINEQSLFFIGRNLDYAVALEASLKLKEISYIHSESYAAGELKHGTISLIEKDRTVFALCSYEDLKEKMISNIKEVVARGAYVISCTTTGNEELEKTSAEVIYIPKTNKYLLPSLEIVPFQIYAYFVAYNKGLDIDKPRNLAKSVTVE